TGLCALTLADRLESAWRNRIWSRCRCDHRVADRARALVGADHDIAARENFIATRAFAKQNFFPSLRQFQQQRRVTLQRLPLCWFSPVHRVSTWPFAVREVRARFSNCGSRNARNLLN